MPKPGRYTPRRGKGIYLALYGSAAYVGRSGDTASRIAWGTHLREYGLPDMVIAAVDRNDALSNVQIMGAERQLCRVVVKTSCMSAINKQLPDGAEATTPEFVVVAQFVRQVVTAVCEAGLAFNQAAGLMARLGSSRTRARTMAHPTAASVLRRLWANRTSSASVPAA